MSDQINKIDQLVTPCFTETGGYALNAKRQKTHPPLSATYVLQIYSSERFRRIQMDERIRDIISDFV